MVTWLTNGPGVPILAGSIEIKLCQGPLTMSIHSSSWMQRQGGVK
jgi:hypothetical protein